MTTNSTIKGPRPLSLHFANSQLIWDAAACAGSAALSADIWHNALDAKRKALREELEKIEDIGAFDALLLERTAQRKNDFLAGVNAYVARRFERPPTSASVSKAIGSATLHDFGGDGVPILLVPSLVNPFGSSPLC